MGKSKLALAGLAAVVLACAAPFSLVYGQDRAVGANPWMSATIIAEQASATSDTALEGVANRRARLLIAAMTLPQKMQQLTGSAPEILPELPQCFGARHVSGIAALEIGRAHV